jgi:hypothetical protein
VSWSRSRGPAGSITLARVRYLVHRLLITKVNVAHYQSILGQFVGTTIQKMPVWRESSLGNSPYLRFDK